MYNFINRDIKINNNKDLEEIIPELEKLINNYYKRPNRRNEWPVTAMHFGILNQVDNYYKEQLKHEMVQTNRLFEKIGAIMGQFFIFSEKHKNQHRRPEFRTDI